MHVYRNIEVLCTQIRSATHQELRFTVSSLVPLAFILCLCSQKQNSSKKAGKVWSNSSREWTRGECREGEADIQICTHKLQSEFLITIQDK